MSAQIMRLCVSILAVTLFLTEAGAIVCRQCHVLGLAQTKNCSEVCDTGGGGCFAEIVMFGGDTSRRWGCIPAGVSLAMYCQSSLAEYNISCCDTEDYCNQELHPSLSTVPPVTTTQALTPTDPTVVPTSASTVAQPSEPTTNPDTTTAPLSSDSNIVSTEAMPQTEPSSSGTHTEPPTTPPTTQAPQPMASQNCYRSKSDRPNDVRLCSLQTSCFVSVRKHADNSLSYRRGCTPQTLPCVPENRNRKIKVCCNTSLCNFEIPNFGGAPNLIPSYDNNTTRTGNITTPVGTTPPDTSVNTPTRLGPTAPNIGTIGQTFSDDPHAPDIDFTNAPSETMTLPTDRSTPAHSVGTTVTATEPVPPETPPPTDGLTGSSTNCVCDSCIGGRCSSRMGCATVYNRVADSESITRICVLTPSICESSDSDFRVVCCQGELCNQANNTETPPTTADMGQTDDTSSSSKETLSIYYILTILMSVIFLAIATALLLICVCAYQHHRKRMAQLRKKQQQEHRTTDSVTTVGECSTRHFNL